MPDRNGAMGDIVLGFDSLDGYLKDHPFFGAIIGRYGNRIAWGRFLLDGQEYKLATNNGPNHLHGGPRGFDQQVWSAEILPANNTIAFRRTSVDGEAGYPGNLVVAVTYALTDNNQLIVDYLATTEETRTPVSTSIGVLSRDPALSRLAEPTQLSLDHHQAGTGIPNENGVHVWR